MRRSTLIRTLCFFALAVFLACGATARAGVKIPVDDQTGGDIYEGILGDDSSTDGPQAAGGLRLNGVVLSAAILAASWFDAGQEEPPDGLNGDLISSLMAPSVPAGRSGDVSGQIWTMTGKPLSGSGSGLGGWNMWTNAPGRTMSYGGGSKGSGGGASSGGGSGGGPSGLGPRRALLPGGLGSTGGGSPHQFQPLIVVTPSDSPPPSQILGGSFPNPTNPFLATPPPIGTPSPTASAPEPSSLLLWGALGAIGLLVERHRRSRSSPPSS